jgi:hypothetical protein
MITTARLRIRRRSLVAGARMRVLPAARIAGGEVVSTPEVEVVSTRDAEGSQAREAEGSQTRDAEGSQTRDAEGSQAGTAMGGSECLL